VLPAHALAVWMALDEDVELGGDRRVAPEREVGLEPVLERRKAQRLQPRALAPGERLGELGQRRPAPQRERPPEARPSAARCSKRATSSMSGSTSIE
jgi:hypothetical protein